MYKESKNLSLQIIVLYTKIDNFSSIICCTLYLYTSSIVFLIFHSSGISSWVVDLVTVTYWSVQILYPSGWTLEIKACNTNTSLIPRSLISSHLTFNLPKSRRSGSTLFDIASAPRFFSRGVNLAKIIKENASEGRFQVQSSPLLALFNRLKTMKESRKVKKIMSYYLLLLNKHGYTNYIYIYIVPNCINICKNSINLLTTTGRRRTPDPFQLKIYVYVCTY